MLPPFAHSSHSRTYPPQKPTAMDALEYLDTIVELTIEEFESARWDRRRAFIACLITFHTIDYLGLDGEKSCKQLRSECPEFETVERVANAFKHTLSRHKPLAVAHVRSRPRAMAGEMRCGSSQIGDQLGAVVADGQDLFAAVKATAAFFRTKAESALNRA
jgi:hypothetical protein